MNGEVDILTRGCRLTGIPLGFCNRILGVPAGGTLAGVGWNLSLSAVEVISYKNRLFWFSMQRLGALYVVNDSDFEDVEHRSAG